MFVLGFVTINILVVFWWLLFFLIIILSFFLGIVLVKKFEFICEVFLVLNFEFDFFSLFGVLFVVILFFFKIIFGEVCGFNFWGGIISFFLIFIVLLVLLEVFTYFEGFFVWFFIIEFLFKGDDVVVVNDVLGFEVLVGLLVVIFSFFGEFFSWFKVVLIFIG